MSNSPLHLYPPKRLCTYRWWMCHLKTMCTQILIHMSRLLSKHHMTGNAGNGKNGSTTSTTGPNNKVLFGLWQDVLIIRPTSAWLFSFHKTNVFYHQRAHPGFVRPTSCFFLFPHFLFRSSNRLINQAPRSQSCVLIIFRDPTSHPRVEDECVTPNYSIVLTSMGDGDYKKQDIQTELTLLWECKFSICAICHVLVRYFQPRNYPTRWIMYMFNVLKVSGTYRCHIRWKFT